MNKMNLIMAGLIISSASLISMTIIFQEDAKPWEIPAKFKSIKNPSAANDESLKAGSMMYAKNCASCHGKTGKGDGIKARALETFPGDFSDSAFQGQTDGELFYKTKFGRGDMPKFENKVADEDIWHIVNYMRSFKK